jgi:hypothetical protein
MNETHSAMMAASTAEIQGGVPPGVSSSRRIARTTANSPMRMSENSSQVRRGFTAFSVGAARYATPGQTYGYRAYHGCMARLLFVLGIVAVTFMIYSIVDAALRPARLIRALPKWAWLLIIIAIPIIGGVLWFVIGRGRVQNATVFRTVGPDDDPDFLGKLGYTTPRDPAQDARTDEQIRDLEKRLSEQGGEQPGDDPKRGSRDQKPGPAL